MKLLLLSLLAFTTFATLSQTMMHSFTNASASKSNQIQLLHDHDNALVFVQQNESDLTIVRYDSDLLPLTEFKLMSSMPKNHEPILSSIFNGTLYLLTSNTAKNKITAIHIDLEKQNEQLRLDLPKLKSEEVLQTYFYQGHSYLLTMSTVNQEFILRKIDTMGEIDTEILNVDYYKFRAKGRKDERLKYLFRYKGIPTIEPNIIKLNDDFPYTLLQTASKSKTYQFENEVLITLDQDISKTTVLRFDLATMTLTIDEIEKPKFSRGASGDSNSRLYNGALYQLVVDSNEMILEVTELSTKQNIFTYRVTDKEPLSITNTPIILEGAAYTNTRVLEKTSKFLRKVSKSDPALTVSQPTKGNYQVTIGASTQMIAGMSDFGGGLQLSHFNPIPSNLLTENQGRATYIKSIFDSDFNHLAGAVHPELLDKIDVYKKNKDIKEGAQETITAYQGGFIYVVFNKGAFEFIRFE